MATDMNTLKNANWDRLERDVVGRIRVLRIIADKMAASRMNDEIANSLILPNLELLAIFCTNIQMDDSGHGGSNGIE